MKMHEITARAKALQLKNSFGLPKAELTRSIQRAEGDFDCFGTAKDDCDPSQRWFREDGLRPSGRK